MRIRRGQSLDHLADGFYCDHDMADTSSTKSLRTVRAWLWLLALLVFCMVILGGATRLTDSGLSITEWQPIMGAIPPFSAADWQEAFERYKLIPEYTTQNIGMSLSEFQYIYWWEWSHRLLGRLIGIAFLLPFVYFLITRTISRKLFWQLSALSLLGAAQGALGWYMVQSGLVDRVDVSQYRLAAHLTLAAALMAALIWTALGIENMRRWQPQRGTRGALILVMMILLQIAAGGFVAGLDAGMGYNTWPKMDGHWIPSGLLSISPTWRNFFESAMTVQFDHRVLAYLIAVMAIIHAWRTFSISAFILAYLIFVQIGMGIFAVILQVPFSLALAHQGGALIVLAAAVWHLHRKALVKQVEPDQPRSIMPSLLPDRR